MIGLMFYGAIGLWVLMAFYLGRKLPKWFNLKPAWAFLFVPLVFIAPFADEIVGDIYMSKVCNLDGGYTFFSPIDSVSNARVEKIQVVRVWHFYAVDRHDSIFIDMDTGKEFGYERSYENDSGFLLRTLGLGSTSRTCNKHANMDGKGGGFDGYKTAKKINELLKSGEKK